MVVDKRDLQALRDRPVCPPVRGRDGPVWEKTMAGLAEDRLSAA
ncbi:MAG TPA: hypothetical protein VGD68_18350 [Streptosporangiaceae bacterium]